MVFVGMVMLRSPDRWNSIDASIPDWIGRNRRVSDTSVSRYTPYLDAVNRLVAVAQPLKVILFGSHARGDADDHSDVDLLVIEVTVSDRHEEMVRLNRALKGLLMPVDLLVVSEQEFEIRSSTPGTVEHAARREGHVLYAA
jgi:predicted nucleotidyltransferase